MADVTAVPSDAKSISPRTFWIWTWIVTGIVAIGTYLLPHTNVVAAGLGWRQLVICEEFLWLAGLMSGLSGFGFSGIAAVVLLYVPKIPGVPLLQTMSLLNQLTSVFQILEDMPRTWKQFWAGTGPCMVGGFVGVPLGLWLLIHLPQKKLNVVFGVFLVLYSLYIMLKPASFHFHGHGFDGPIGAATAGFTGGAVGGFTGFPGSMPAVWAGLGNLPKAMTRAIVQPFVIVSQLYTISILAVRHPEYYGHTYWVLLGLTLPVALTGTTLGVALYHRINDVNFRRVCAILLGVSGAALLIQLFYK
jgi:uncharacterized membrane protein YfcA